eukprot:13143508-Alexandrium_andersonii.AAC.1
MAPSPPGESFWGLNSTLLGGTAQFRPRTPEAILHALGPHLAQMYIKGPQLRGRGALSAPSALQALQLRCKQL